MFIKIRNIIFYPAALGVATLSLLFAPTQVVAKESPCGGSLAYLNKTYNTEEKTRVAFDKIYAGLQDLPVGYSYNKSQKNPWKAAGSGKGLHKKMKEMFETWCTALPKIKGDSDNALDPILYFAWIYYQNQAGQDFVQGRDPKLKTGPHFLSRWNKEYRKYMDSEESAKIVPEWVADPRLEIEDYELTNAISYNSWNEFFARNLKTDSDGSYPSRPVTMPVRDYVIVSPTDCIMNPLVQVIKKDDAYDRKYIKNPLQLDTVLDVKNIPISVNDMLGSVPDKIKHKFVGGNGLACVLMPNTYHHFHSPVDGTVIHAEVVKTGTKGTPGTFGYPDFPNWVPNDGNVGRPGTDFSQFQAFQRGVIIIEVEYDNLPGKEERLCRLHSCRPGLCGVGGAEQMRQQGYGQCELLYSKGRKSEEGQDQIRQLLLWRFVKHPALFGRNGYSCGSNSNGQPDRCYQYREVAQIALVDGLS